MALDRATYLEHLRRIFARVVSLNEDEAIGPVLRATLDYVQSGNLGTTADRTEAARIVANLLWQSVLGRTYNGHQMKHWLVSYGITVAADIPNLSEPVA